MIQKEDLSLIYKRASYFVRQKASIYYLQDGCWTEEDWECCEQFLERNVILNNHFYSYTLNCLTAKPTMIVFAGCNGAGKSTLIESFLGRRDSLINPDLIAAEINPLNPRSVDYLAGRYAIEKLKRCIDSRMSFQIETTLTGNYMLNQMRLAKEAGYLIYL